MERFEGSVLEREARVSIYTIGSPMIERRIRRAEGKVWNI